jgi:hypothetical protein
VWTCWAWCVVCVAAGIGLAGLGVWTCYSGGLLRGLAWLGPGYFWLLFECLGCSLSLGLVAVWAAGSYLVLFDLCGLGLAVQQIWWACYTFSGYILC